MLNNSAESHLNESRIGIMIFVISLVYCMLIVLLDSRGNKKFVVSKNMFRHLLDGLTLSTGCTIAFAIYDDSVFAIVASNAVYVTITALTCIFGPLINLAERYARVIDR